MQDDDLPSEFRYFAVCHGAGFNDAHLAIEPVDNLVFRSGELPSDAKLTAVVGAFLSQSMAGKPLDLVAWPLNNSNTAYGRGERIDLRGGPLILPRKDGCVSARFDISVPIASPGLYGLDLFDRYGIFGPAEGLLATYLFGVVER